MDGSIVVLLTSAASMSARSCESSSPLLAVASKAAAAQDDGRCRGHLQSAIFVNKNQIFVAEMKHISISPWK